MLDWLNCLTPQQAGFVGTLAGSGFGLIALLIGAFVNAHLNRLRDDRLRRQEAHALAITFYTELTLIKEQLKIPLETFNNVYDKEEKTPPSVISSPDVEYWINAWPDQITNIGLFDSELSGAVTLCYTELFNFRIRMVQANSSFIERAPGVHGYNTPTDYVGEGRAVHKLLDKALSDAISGLKAFLKKEGIVFPRPSPTR